MRALIDRLETLAGRATPQPWRVRPMPANAGGCREIQAHAVSSAGQRQQWISFAQTDGLYDDETDKANAALLVSLVNAAPDIIRLIRAARVVTETTSCSLPNLTAAVEPFYRREEHS